MMKIIFIIAFLLQSNLALSFENVINGVRLTRDNESSLRGTSLPYAIARQGQRAADNNELVESYLEVSDSIYSLSSKPSLIQTKTSGRTLLGHWPLSAYSEHLFLLGENVAAYESIAGVHGKTIDASTDILSIVNRGEVYMRLTTSETYNSEGCLQHTPLRYGDINGDSNSEIVLFLGLNTKIVIFSPIQQKVIFSTHFFLNDELDSEEVFTTFGRALTETEPQYVSDSGTDVLVTEILPAKRSLSKLYMSEFNADGQHDIVVWRKLYESRLGTDPIKGFSRIGERFVHYSLINGIYKLQSTDSATVKSWLTNKNLTWQKGYPNLSECADQTSQHIPEMIDPLLNDPDVLN